MALAYSVVDGRGFAREASEILQEAWIPPVPDYTPDYVGWQLAFPSQTEALSVVAQDGSRAVGFMAGTERLMSAGGAAFPVAIVGFVAVRPEYRGQGIAGELYRLLLDALAAKGMPVVTYGIPGSGGQRALLRAYPDAGYTMHSLGRCDNYAFQCGRTAPGDAWIASFADFDGMREIAAECTAARPDTLWSYPDERQLAHYEHDPRDRKLVIVENRATGQRGAGFGIFAPIRTAQGVQRAVTLDAVWISDSNTDALIQLLEKLGTAWPGAGSVIMCPNLSGFEPDRLRAARIRKTQAAFDAYFCFAGNNRWPSFQRTNLEIV